MKNLLVILCTINLCLISSLAFSQEDTELSKPGYNSPMTEKDKQIIKESQRETPEERERSRNIFKEAVKASVRDIAFYGKVVDFDGNPVPEAVAVISVRNFDPAADVLFSSKKHELTTDSNGLFEFQGKGISLTIRDIIKEGYEFKREYLDYTSFQYDIKIKNKHGQALPFDPNSIETYMFKIRKNSVVDYLLTNSFRWSFRKSENKPFAPLLLEEWIDRYGKAKNPGARRSEQNKCIEISCAFNEDFSVFTLSFKGIVEGCSAYLSDTLLYEAPAEGYQSQITYRNTMVKSGENEQKAGWYEKKLYLYVKGPEDSYYSRIDLSLSTDTIHHFADPLVQLHGEIYTNPNGRRYLDYDEDYNGKEYMTRLLIKKERHKDRSEAMKQKKEFDEEAFKKKIDQERELIKEEVNEILNNSK